MNPKILQQLLMVDLMQFVYEILALMQITKEQQEVKKEMMMHGKHLKEISLEFSLQFI